MQSNTIDDLDLEILEIMQANGGLSNKEIAVRLKKSASTIFERITVLRREGYIEKTVAIVNRLKFNDLWIAFSHVKLTNHSSEALSDFQEEIILFSEVLECYHTTGDYDFLLKIAVSDMPHYNEFIMKKLTKLKNVGKLNSTFVVKEAKRETAYPLRYSESKKKL